jgi:hypothetical protein
VTALNPLTPEELRAMTAAMAREEARERERERAED